MTASATGRGGRRPGAGRPFGARSDLLRDRRRFAVAMLLALGTELRLSDRKAAELAVALLGSRTRIVAESVPRLPLVRFGIELGANDAAGGSLLKERARRLLTRYRRLQDGATAAERGWLVESASLINTLLLAARTDNGPMFALAFRMLDGMGWGPTLAALGRRLGPALASNFPPMEGAIPRHTLVALARTAAALIKTPPPRRG